MRKIRGRMAQRCGEALALCQGRTGGCGSREGAEGWHPWAEGQAREVLGACPGTARQPGLLCSSVFIREVRDNDLSAFLEIQEVILFL